MKMVIAKPMADARLLSKNLYSGANVSNRTPISLRASAAISIDDLGDSFALIFLRYFPLKNQSMLKQGPSL
jgi:hypothetical protein